MRRVNTCLNCPDRVRIVTEEKIIDCHSTCKKYKDAYDRETEIMNRAIKAKRGDREHLAYMQMDKEKRRRMHFQCKT